MEVVEIVLPSSGLGGFSSEARISKGPYASFRTSLSAIGAGGRPRRGDSSHEALVLVVEMARTSPEAGIIKGCELNV